MRPQPPLDRLTSDRKTVPCFEPGRLPLSLSSLPAHSSPAPREPERLRRDSPQPVAHRAAAVPLPDSMAALGDSITQAYDATPTKHLLTDQPQWSWSTGYAGAKVVDSQYERLLTAGDR